MTEQCVTAEQPCFQCKDTAVGVCGTPAVIGQPPKNTPVTIGTAGIAQSLLPIPRDFTAPVQHSSGNVTFAGSR